MCICTYTHILIYTYIRTSGSGYSLGPVLFLTGDGAVVGGGELKATGVLVPRAGRRPRFYIYLLIYNNIPI